MNPQIIYDILGIGIGPFNLGLAALCFDLPELNCIFFDQSPEFNWHPGMMLPNAKLQVPFYADLISIVNPKSDFTFMNYLKETESMLRFFIYENNFVTRKEYNHYCKWVASHLSTLHFNQSVTEVHYDKEGEIYLVTVLNAITGEKQNFQARHVVLGIGTEPSLPKCAEGVNHPLVIHSSDYLRFKDELISQPSISIIGSGQSAAEIFLDLLQENSSEQSFDLNWFTRSERFYPMEYSKLTLEMTSRDYIDFFFSLKPEKKTALLKLHDNVYKGINFSLINEIWDTLYMRDPGEQSSCIFRSIVNHLSRNKVNHCFGLMVNHHFGPW